MTANSKIEWCDHTLNVWWGCARVSPGCVNCYADTLASRWGHQLWRRHGPRKAMSAQYWREPIKWNRTDPGRVFCGSMCDPFEAHPTPDVRVMQDTERARLWDLIDRTQNLTWLLLTKRPENVAAMVPWTGDWPRNVWIGTSVEDQARADERIPTLLRLPGTRFLSCEPLLGPLDLRAHFAGYCPEHDFPGGFCVERHHPGVQHVDWIIAGGESGAKARPVHPDWIRSLRDQCQKYNRPFHFKQWGEWAPSGSVGIGSADRSRSIIVGPPVDDHGCGTELTRVGKKAAGRELDGRTWDEFPVVTP